LSAISYSSRTIDEAPNVLVSITWQPASKNELWTLSTTSGVDQDILEGITRASVIELAKSFGINVIERPVDKTELLIADEVFLTGTAAKITPVKKIESTELNVERPIMNKLKSKLIEITEGRSQDYDNWVTRISLK
jgi:branched-chain amino acid aminotransferase